MNIKSQFKFIFFILFILSICRLAYGSKSCNLKESEIAALNAYVKCQTVEVNEAKKTNQKVRAWNSCSNSGKFHNTMLKLGAPTAYFLNRNYAKGRIAFLKHRKRAKVGLIIRKSIEAHMKERNKINLNPKQAMEIRKIYQDLGDEFVTFLNKDQNKQKNLMKLYKTKFAEFNYRNSVNYLYTVKAEIFNHWDDILNSNKLSSKIIQEVKKVNDIFKDKIIQIRFPKLTKNLGSSQTEKAIEATSRLARKIIKKGRLGYLSLLLLLPEVNHGSNFERQCGPALPKVSRAHIKYNQDCSPDKNLNQENLKLIARAVRGENAEFDVFPELCFHLKELYKYLIGKIPVVENIKCNRLSGDKNLLTTEVDWIPAKNGELYKVKSIHNKKGVPKKLIITYWKKEKKKATYWNNKKTKITNRRRYTYLFNQFGEVENVIVPLGNGKRMFSLTTEAPRQLENSVSYEYLDMSIDNQREAFELYNASKLNIPPMVACCSLSGKELQYCMYKFNNQSSMTSPSSESYNTTK